MNEIISEIIPVTFYLIAIIFYVASLGGDKNVDSKKNTLVDLDKNDEKVRSFLNDSEKKLIALKELYQQNLIDLDLYVEKTNQIAEIVSKVVGNNIFDYAKKKNNQVISDLKSGIFKKLSYEIKPENKKVDIDELLVSIDSKIKNNKNSGVINEK